VGLNANCEIDSSVQTLQCNTRYTMYTHNENINMEMNLASKPGSALSFLSDHNQFYTTT